MAVQIKRLGLQDYETVWQQMQDFNQARDAESNDEIWLVEHPPVYTLGLNAKREHLLNISDIAVVETDRGGQVTYHGPGQLVLYVLLDLQRLDIGVRKIVTLLEQAMITTLAQFGVSAQAKADAPGVYVAEKKIGSVGLRVKRGCCYHGLSFNNNIDLTPFKGINTFGYPALEVTQLADLNINISTAELAVPVVHHILQTIEQ